jgi:hypothetical protein
MDDMITLEILVKYVNLLSSSKNPKALISFEELNKELFPEYWKTVRKALFSRMLRSSDYDPDCYCD